jgi:cytochrome c
LAFGIFHPLACSSAGLRLFMCLKSFIFLCAAAGGLYATGAAAQSVGLDLVRANNCISCHLVDKKRTGPAFDLVAKRFAGQSGAADYLSGAIRSGGRGRWGAVPMPAQPQVSEHDAQVIARWILSLDAAGDQRP